MSEQPVVAQAIPASGSLSLGCWPPEHRWVSAPEAVELYLFRMWEDVSSHGPCEDGTLVGWNTQYWGPNSSWERDPNLQCGETPVLS